MSIAKRIDGHVIAETIQKGLMKRIEALSSPATPHLAVLMVGDNKASTAYVRKKGAVAEALGMKFSLHTADTDSTTEEIIHQIQTIQQDPSVSGLIVQLPLPKKINTAAVVNSVRPDIDVDCLTNENIGRLVTGTATLLPPTPTAVLHILEKELAIDLVGKNITIIGVGPLVGKPLAIMLMNKRASVTTCNSETKDLKEKCLNADIIVTGVGKSNTLRGDMVSPGTIVIDAGIDFIGDTMHGDVHIEEVEKTAAYLTATPGGVGPITIALLLQNTVACAEART